MERLTILQLGVFLSISFDLNSSVSYTQDEDKGQIKKEEIKMLQPNAEIKTFEVLFVTEKGVLLEKKIKGKFLNDVKFVLWDFFGKVDILDVKVVEK